MAGVAARKPSNVADSPRFGGAWHNRIWPAALMLILVTAYATERGIKYGREFIHADAVLATNGGYALYQYANMFRSTPVARRNSKEEVTSPPNVTIPMKAEASDRNPVLTNAAQSGHRLVQIGFEDGIYFFRGTVIGDWFGPGRYRDLLECSRLPCALPPPARLQAIVHKHGARMLLLNRSLIIGLDVVALQKAGWRVLAENANGVLLAIPGTAGP